MKSVTVGAIKNLNGAADHEILIKANQVSMLVVNQYYALLICKTTFFNN
jgi:hypothetical protein